MNVTASAGIALCLMTGVAWVAPLQTGNAAVPMTCGTDEIVAQPYPLRPEYVIRAGDSRMFTPCQAGPHDDTHREAREAAVIQAAMQSPDPLLRRAAAQAYGKLGPSSMASGPLLALLKDADVRVRLEAARAIPHALDGVLGERTLDVTRVRVDPSLIESARAALVDALSRDSSDDLSGALLESIGILKYPDDRARDGAETFLVAAITGAPGRVLGAVKGLEALIRANPKRPVGEAARVRLRELVRAGPAGRAQEEVAARTRRLAMLALQTARDEDVPTLVAAARDTDWQLRRLAALRMDGLRADLVAPAAQLERDASFQVRYEMATVRSRALIGAPPKDCTPLLKFFEDRHPLVVMRAIDLLPADCAAPAEIVARLQILAGELQNPKARSWHVAARAINALARVAPNAARPHLDRAAAHDQWQVRAMAATTAGAIADASLVARLAADKDPNVQNAALEATRRFGNAALTTAAIAALAGGDHQLLRTAATMMPDPAATDRDKVAAALLGALARLTTRGEDTSRDPRVAILTKLATILPAERHDVLRPYLTDFDPRVRAAAATAWQRLAGAAPEPVIPRFRYPMQPAIADLAGLPTQATIEMANGGMLQLELFANDAPVTVARFAAVARDGGYNRLTFHRMAPNFVIQGGSPGANEYVGAPRYMRDEVGMPNLRGTVGISTRGRDTGDAQIFINLIDSPRLDHEYTVFARLISGLDVLDGILEGAEIRAVAVK